MEQASPTNIPSSQYGDVRQYLEHGTLPSDLSTRKKRVVILKNLPYLLVHEVIFRKHHNKVMLKCLEAPDLENVLCDLHDGPVGGHFTGDTTKHKVMRSSFYCPTLFKDAHTYDYKCSVCQKCVNQGKKSVSPLHPIVVEEPFQQWVLDVIGDIFLHSSKQHHYILTATYYFTQWIEAVPLKQVNDQEVIKFLKDNIITRFSVLTSLGFTMKHISYHSYYMILHWKMVLY